MANEKIHELDVIIFPTIAYIIGSSRKELFFSFLDLDDYFFKKRKLDEKKII